MGFTVQFSPGWHLGLSGELQSNYMQALSEFLASEAAEGKTIYPAAENYFRALELTPLEKVKVVILGQDPYHGPGNGTGQAHGLAFSVQPDVKVPPSLKNIYKEMADDLGIQQPNHGFLDAWAREGVLLLNTVLTVEAGNAGSHQGKGWERFTDGVVELVSTECAQVVFILWGSHAQKKGAKIDRSKHLVIEGPHPSPLSAYRGFFGCKHFSKANAYLKENGKAAVNWQLSPIGELPF